MREPGARLGFDGADQAHHDVVEYADLLFWMTCRAADNRSVMRVSISTRRELVPDVSAASSSSISGRLRIIGRMPRPIATPTTMPPEP